MPRWGGGGGGGGEIKKKNTQASKQALYQLPVMLKIVKKGGVEVKKDRVDKSNHILDRILLRATGSEDRIMIARLRCNELLSRSFKALEGSTFNTC